MNSGGRLLRSLLQRGCCHDRSMRAGAYRRRGASEPLRTVAGTPFEIAVKFILMNRMPRYSVLGPTGGATTSPGTTRPLECAKPDVRREGYVVGHTDGSVGCTELPKRSR